MNGPKRSVAYLLSSLLEAMENCRKSGNAEWLEKHGQRIASIVSTYMPSGAGWDCGTKLDMDKSARDKLVFYGSFHHMDDWGGYDGWTDHTITVRPGFTGPSITISGRDRNNIKAYIHELFYDSLSRIVED